MLFGYYTFSFVRKVLLRQCCFVSTVDNKKRGFFFKKNNPILDHNISLKSDDKVKTKIRKISEKIIPVRRKRVESCLTPNWEFSSIPTLNSKFINQIVYSTSPYKHFKLSCSQQSFQFFFSKPSFSNVLSHLSFWQLLSFICSAYNLDQPPSFLKVKCPHWSPCFFPYHPKVSFLISSQNILVKACSKLLAGWLLRIKAKVINNIHKALQELPSSTLSLTSLCFISNFASSYSPLKPSGPRYYSSIMAARQLAFLLLGTLFPHIHISFIYLLKCQLFIRSLLTTLLKILPLYTQYSVTNSLIYFSS